MALEIQFEYRVEARLHRLRHIMEDQEEISFQPHYHTMTMAGNSHFLRVADALAEIIDNSIQACEGVEDIKEVHVKLFLQKYGSSNFAVVMDNGCGMDKDTLQEFATYSLDRATRNRATGIEKRSFISKFGVGAKQAGFFLGERIRVLTKLATDDDVVREFVLDSLEFESRYRNNEDVFSGVINKRSVGACAKYMPSDEQKVPSLSQAIKFHETTHKSFTIVVIKLKDDLVRRLLNVSGQQEHRLLHSELAEIYHFHVHPHDRPVISDPRLDGLLCVVLYHI